MAKTIFQSSACPNYTISIMTERVLKSKFFGSMTNRVGNSISMPFSLARLKMVRG